MLSKDNVEELVNFAVEHSTRETEAYVAKLRPRAASPERLRGLSEDRVQLQTTITPECERALRRVQDLLAQKQQNAGISDALEAALTEYISRHDPVEKAKRAENRKVQRAKTRSQAKAAESKATQSASPAHAVQMPTDWPLSYSASFTPPQPQAEEPRPFCARRKRQPLTAAQKHAVQTRDGGQCTFRDEHGRRCTERRWLHVHHIHHVADGGDNSPDNLTSLCSAHHDLVHQLSFPIEGQRSWLREPIVEYRVN